MKKILTILLLTFTLSLSAKQDTTFCTVTYYRLVGTTASGERTHAGCCAVSPDLLKKYPYGSYIVVEGYGTFKVTDRTSSRHRNWVDIWRPNGKGFKNGKKVKVTKK